MTVRHSSPVPKEKDVVVARSEPAKEDSKTLASSLLEKAVEKENRAVSPTDNASDDGEGGIDPNARPACFSSTATEIIFVLTVTMAIAMSNFMVGGISVITSYIGEDLNMTGAAITWLNAAPNLACGSFLLLFGKLADLFGRKNFFIASLGLFAVLSLGAGFAKSGIGLDAICGAMGLAAAAAVPAAIGSLGSVYPVPSRRKNYAFACFSAGNPLGFVIGTFCSGITTQIFSWRASFWFLSIVYGVVAVLAVFTVPAEEQREGILWDKIRKFDYLGALLMVTGMGMLSAALTSGTDAVHGWKTPYILVLLILGVMFLVIFVGWERECQDPLMPMWIWRDRDFSLLNVIQFLTSAGFASCIFWITLFFQRFWAAAPVSVALYVLPMAIMGITVNVIVALIMHRISNKLLLALACACYVVSSILLALNKTSSVYWAFCFPAFLMIVWGADITFGVGNMYVMSALPEHQQSVAGSISQCLTRLATTLGLALTTTVYQAVDHSPLPATGYYKDDPAAPYAATFWFLQVSAPLALFWFHFSEFRRRATAER